MQLTRKHNPDEVTRMRISPKQFLQGLLYAAPILLLALASCGGGGGGGTTTPPVAPSTAPTGVTASTGCSSINLNWNAVAGATGYNVYGAASGVTATKLTATPVTTLSYTDKGLNATTTYNYQVTAVNSAGEGPGSNQATATTLSSCSGGSIQGTPLTLSTVVSTLAGKSGIAGFNNATGTAATFNFPNGITTDGTNLYLADSANNAIRKIVISTGVVTTLAGAASPGAGDGIGTAAAFNNPRGITTDGTYLYVADTGNNAIRKILISTGDVSTIVPGSAGFLQPAGITFDGTNLYVSDTGHNRIAQVTTAGTGLNLLFATGLNAPQGITFDGTNFYVADTAKSNISMVTTVGAVTTFAGTGTAGNVDATGTAAAFSSPQGITTDGTYLYVADTGNHTIRKILISSVAVTTIAGTGTAGNVDATGTSASFYNPSGITTDGTNLYDVDWGKSTIREIQ